MRNINIVNGFFPNKNFGDDMFLACAGEYVEGDYEVRNLAKENKGYLAWLAYLFKRVKSYTWLGGTFIDKDTTFPMLISMLIEFTLVKLAGAKLTFVSVGLSRDVNLIKKLSLKYICWLANDVSARDKDSFEAYKRHNKGMTLTGDIVVLNEGLFHKGIKQSNRRLLFVSVDKNKSLQIFNDKQSVFKHLSNTPSVVQVTSPYQAESQKRLSEEICNSLGCSYDCIDYSSFKEVLELIAESECVITDRLHVAIAGVINNKPVYLFGVSEKLKGINDLLDTRGLLTLVS
ncbi:polysaccharide pyruvyl transferase family protein [Pseudoalteromonas luteoviolacea]|uniref:Polysaccharide pyruvyl transferase domain-containing protein n=1 Tax=Pseudoalteromonas luteoviolacea NCIMB 1942 TaxID=1365253 RepID=A0A166ZIU9_9GAMM|nr:polysaccharide pyruvyl transferase family protein [Pseudoalteromonas luteoviolacea]KZN44358.1 hypothetical protein N482_16455 [Pseudoalteromonas luteoviolacea NCIMB 1942]